MGYYIKVEVPEHPPVETRRMRDVIGDAIDYAFFFLVFGLTLAGIGIGGLVKLGLSYGLLLLVIAVGMLVLGAVRWVRRSSS